MCILVVLTRASTPPTAMRPLPTAHVSHTAEERGGTRSSTPTPAQPPTTPTPTAMPTPTQIPTGTVVLWHSWTGQDGDALLEILTSFHQQQPKIRVETLFVAYGDLPDAYASAVRAGSGPDLMLAPNWWLPDLVAVDVLLPLENKISKEERMQFIPAAIENLSFEGLLYGLPTNYELVALYYNKRLLPEANLPRTTEDFIDLALASPSQGVGIYTNFYHIFWGIPAYGSTLFDDDGRVIIEQTAGTANFLGWLLRAKNTPGIFVDLDYGMLIDRFKKEEYAFFIDGPWSAGELWAVFGEDLGVSSLPAGPVGPARPWLSTDGVFLNPTITAQQQELALIMARHLTNAESASHLAQIAGRLPAHVAANPGTNPLVAGFMAQGASALPEPHRREINEVWGYAGDMIGKVLSGDATPEEAVLEAATLINEANGK